MGVTEKENLAADKVIKLSAELKYAGMNKEQGAAEVNRLQFEVERLALTLTLTLIGGEPSPIRSRTSG